MTTSQSYQHHGSTIFIVSSEAAKGGHLRVVRSRRRSYGYSFLNVILGQTACWYRHKRDALARLEELKVSAS
jgi:hypothetical protein